MNALHFAFSEADDAGEQVTKLKFRADCLPFPHLLDAVGYETGISCILRGGCLAVPPYALSEHCEPGVLLRSGL